MLALLILSIIVVVAPFIHAAITDTQERRRRERAQDLEDYRDILGGDE